MEYCFPDGFRKVLAEGHRLLQSVLKGCVASVVKFFLLMLKMGPEYQQIVNYLNPLLSPSHINELSELWLCALSQTLV